MRKSILLLSLLLAVSPVSADEQIRSAQQTLKEEGFYFGAVDGKAGPETSAAIRRFQIRNGLEVNGALDSKTKEALGLQPSANTEAPSPAPQVAVKPAPSAPTMPRSTPAPRNTPLPQIEDREFLESEENGVARGNLVGESELMALLFARTPFERAPLEVQRDTLARAQSALRREGLYFGSVGSRPNGELDQAIVDFQARRDLRRTGRLDGETLRELGLMPGMSKSPYHTEPARKVYRGIWVR